MEKKITDYLGCTKIELVRNGGDGGYYSYELKDDGWHFTGSYGGSMNWVKKHDAFTLKMYCGTEEQPYKHGWRLEAQCYTLEDLWDELDLPIPKRKSFFVIAEDYEETIKK